jgi:hypothetical protein
MAKLVTYRTAEKGCVGVRYESGPAVKIGSRVAWLRGNNDPKGGKR